MCGVCVCARAGWRSSVHMCAAHSQTGLPRPAAVAFHGERFIGREEAILESRRSGSARLGGQARLPSAARARVHGRGHWAAAESWRLFEALARPSKRVCRARCSGPIVRALFPLSPKRSPLSSMRVPREPHWREACPLADTNLKAGAPDRRSAPSPVCAHGTCSAGGAPNPRSQPGPRSAGGKTFSVRPGSVRETALSESGRLGPGPRF